MVCVPIPATIQFLIWILDGEIMVNHFKPPIFMASICLIHHFSRRKHQSCHWTSPLCDEDLVRKKSPKWSGSSPRGEMWRSLGVGIPPNHDEFATYLVSIMTFPFICQTGSIQYVLVSPFIGLKVLQSMVCSWMVKEKNTYESRIFLENRGHYSHRWWHTCINYYKLHVWSIHMWFEQQDYHQMMLKCPACLPTIQLPRSLKVSSAAGGHGWFGCPGCLFIATLATVGDAKQI